MLDLNKWAKKIHEHNIQVGWWDGDPCIYEKLQLVSTEIAEATEAERKDLMDDKLPHRKGGEVELADALIRVLDLMGKIDVKINTTEWIDCYKFFTYSSSVAGYHLHINATLIDLTNELTMRGRSGVSSYELDSVYVYEFKMLIMSIYHCAEKFNYDIESAMIEKFEYNKTRVDHKRENRAKEGGKKF